MSKSKEEKRYSGGRVRTVRVLHAVVRNQEFEIDRMGHDAESLSVPFPHWPFGPGAR